VATAEFSKFADILSAALSQHHLVGFEIAQLEFHHLHWLGYGLFLPVGPENSLNQVLEGLSWKERRRESESVTLKITMIKKKPLLIKSLCMVCMTIEISYGSGMHDKKIRREKI